jgi:Cu-Zn family superoxide dismutase
VIHPSLRFAPLALVVFGCAGQPSASTTTASVPIQPPTAGPTPPPNRIDVRATATINDVSNTTIGNATFSDTEAGLLVSISITGLGIGPHGAHLHAVGSCVTPTFTSAGPHFNPDNRQHGFRNSAGYHAGDMPNIISPPSGTHRVQFVVEGVKLTGRGALIDDDGASIVVHTGEDDFLTDPSGNSGGRYACGVIKLVPR